MISVLPDITCVLHPFFFFFLQLSYKGRPLLYHCPTTHPCSVPIPTNTTALTSPPQHTHLPLQTSDIAIQVDPSVLSLTTGRSTCQRSPDEQWLNERLSTSVVRLLNKSEFLANADLPNGFWTTDYSKVKLPQSLWNTVDCW